MTRWVEVRAPGKVNLRLEVLGQRQDGFHELATAMLAVDLEDRVYARRSAHEGLALSISGPAASEDIPTDGRNLVWRAAAAVLDSFVAQDPSRTEPGLELHLHKQVPSRAGLGGGSSDAAATLRAVSAALDFELSYADRIAILSELGSDTVFFEAAAHTGYAWCLGRGEDVHPIETRRPTWTVAVFVPSVSASTGAVYRALGLERSESVLEVPPLNDPLDGQLDHARASLFNGLESAAWTVEPELELWRSLFDSSGIEHACLSGSGAAWFALFPSIAAAEEAVQRVEAAAAREGLGIRGCFVTEPIGRGVSAPVEVDQLPVVHS
ncbi:MAG: 4-(cytidine 5'-diphospho)-2-C-methyl-D-erythritol kinase [Planctomycetota bacterium]|jgi:4-diphosphocytidyl-2-C-methyl-D-erythritol kinase